MVDEARSHTQIAQVTMAVTVAIVLLFLTKPLQYLPNAVLAAVVFLIGLKLIDIANMKDIWNLRRDEFWIAAITAIVVVVVGVEQGIIVAIILSIVVHVRRHYVPRDAVISWDSRDNEVELDATPGHPDRAGIDRLPLRRRPVLRERRPPVGGGQRVDQRGPTAALVRPARRGDRRRRLHRWQDAARARRRARRAATSSSRSPTPGPAVRRELDRFGVTAKIGENRLFDTADDARAAFHSARPAVG